MSCPMSESPSGKREGLQDNATCKKGSLLLTGVRAPATSNAVVRGSESPEPRLLHKFIGQAHTVGSWFKQIGYKFAKQFHWSNTLKTFVLTQDFPGGFRPVPNWQTVVSVKLIGCIQVA